MNPGPGLSFAILGAAGYGLASVLEAVGARGHHGSLRTLTHPAYLAGLTLDLLAWCASLVALRSLAIYDVQSVLAGSLAVTALAARVVLDHRLRAADWYAIGTTVLALVVIAASAGPQPEVALTNPVARGLALSAIPICMAGWLVSRAGHAGLTGAMAGLAFGGAAVCARSVILPARPGDHLVASLQLVVAQPLAWAILAFGIAGMVLYASALEHGRVGPVTALLWIAEVIAPSAAGVVLLHDSIRPGWVPAVLVAMVTALAAAVVLASGAEISAPLDPALRRRPGNEPGSPPSGPGSLGEFEDGEAEAVEGHLAAGQLRALRDQR